MSNRTLERPQWPARAVLAQLNRCWRIVGTGISFSLFGLGGLLLGLVVYPVLRISTRDPTVLRRRMQFLIHLSFRLFVEIMVQLRVMSHSIEGKEILHQPSQLIVANHPTLIDVVLLIAQMPQANCIVKASLFRNPFTAGPVRSAGYVANADSENLIWKCQDVLDSGQSLVVFPEGTRTTPGQRPRLRRGTANIALLTARPIVPVVIDCRPSTLTKGLPWYRVPERKFHMTLRVGSPIDSREILAASPNRSIAARALTRHLEHYFWGDEDAASHPHVHHSSRSII